MNDEGMSEWTKANYIHPEALRTLIVVVHVMAVVTRSLSDFDKREHGASVVRSLEEFLMLGLPLFRVNVCSVVHQKDPILQAIPYSVRVVIVLGCSR
jgi:hypothetical protein